MFLAAQSASSLRRILDSECADIFRVGKSEENKTGIELTLHQHQSDAIQVAKKGESYVLTTGTGSGKSLSYFIPIVDDVLRKKESGRREKRDHGHRDLADECFVQQPDGELDRFLRQGYGTRNEPVTFARYTGQESKEERKKIAAQPPDILLTNYVMLELIMTRFDPADQAVVEHAKGLSFWSSTSYTLIVAGKAQM